MTSPKRYNRREVLPAIVGMAAAPVAMGACVSSDDRATARRLVHEFEAAQRAHDVNTEKNTAQINHAEATLPRAAAHEAIRKLEKEDEQRCIRLMNTQEALVRFIIARSGREWKRPGDSVFYEWPTAAIIIAGVQYVVIQSHNDDDLNPQVKRLPAANIMNLD
jgi:hypothetical protein